jgi:hypothetical protein
VLAHRFLSIIVYHVVPFQVTEINQFALSQNTHADHSAQFRTVHEEVGTTKLSLKQRIESQYVRNDVAGMLIEAASN